jgi:hypothetical protein
MIRQGTTGKYVAGSPNIPDRFDRRKCLKVTSDLAEKSSCPEEIGRGRRAC